MKGIARKRSASVLYLASPQGHYINFPTDLGILNIEKEVGVKVERFINGNRCPKMLVRLLKKTGTI